LSLEENKAIVRKLIEAMDRGDLSILDQLCTPDLKVHFMGRELDLAQIKEAAAAFNAAFPDLRHTIEDLTADEDRVALRARDRAIHRGSYRGIAPTGRSVEFEITVVYRIASGRIAEVWQEMDVEGLLRQLR